MVQSVSPSARLEQSGSEESPAILAYFPRSAAPPRLRPSVPERPYGPYPRIAAESPSPVLDWM
eukprot:scaffold114_cov175-Amphora_coffeaeformis.AAC.2